MSLRALRFKVCPRSCSRDLPLVAIAFLIAVVVYQTLLLNSSATETKGEASRKRQVVDSHLNYLHNNREDVLSNRDRVHNNSEDVLSYSDHVHNNREDVLNNSDYMHNNHDHVNNNHKYTDKYIAEISMDIGNTTKFLSMDAQQVIDFPRPEYILESRNPCFYADISSISYLSEAEKERRYRITCLPLVYFFGVQKAGTSDFHAKLVQHQHIVEGMDKEPHFWNVNRPDILSWYTMGRYTEMYQHFASVVENCCLSAPASCHVDDFTPDPTNTHVVRRKETGLNKTQEKLNDFSYNDLNERVMRGSERCPLVTVDSTVRSLYDSFNWERDPRNEGFDEPQVLTAERLYHFVPNAKTIILLRNPIERTISDFRFFASGSKNADSFHRAVEKGMAWWKKCLGTLSERRCSYGTFFSENNLEDLPDKMKWGNNGAARLRIGMYIIYIRRWLTVFPREQLLILNLSEVDKDPIRAFKETVYPFLEMEPLSDVAEEKIKSLILQGNIHKTDGHEFAPYNTTLDMLKELYTSYNKQLADFTGDNSFLWL